MSDYPCCENPWVLSTTLKGSFYGGVVELVDQADSKSVAEKRACSNHVAAIITCHSRHPYSISGELGIS